MNSGIVSSTRSWRPSANQPRRSMSMSRAFWLIRHADDGRVARLNRFADLLIQGVRKEMQRLESLS